MGDFAVVSLVPSEAPCSWTLPTVQLRKTSLLARAADVAAGLRDEWKNRMAKVSKPGKDPVVRVRYLTAARQTQPWRSAFDGAAAVRSVCQWIQRTVSGLTKLSQNMRSDADRANIIPAADGPTLRADLRSSLQEPQGQGVARKDLPRRSSPRKRPNSPPDAGVPAAGPAVQTGAKTDASKKKPGARRRRRRKARTFRCPDPEGPNFHKQTFRDFKDLLVPQTPRVPNRASSIVYQR